MKTRLRALGTAVAGSAPARTTVRRLARWERDHRDRPGSLAIITYHRIAGAQERPDLMASLRSTDPAGFEAQIELLAEHHRFLSVDELLDLRRRGAAPPPRAAVITFDDAYADLAEHAWPILHRRSIPAIAFVPTGFVDGDRAFWWDAVHHALSATSAGVLDWNGRRVSLASRRDRLDAVRTVRTEVKAMPHRAALEAVDRLVEGSGVAIEPAPVLGWDRLRQLHDEGLTLAPHTRTHAFLDRVSDDDARSEIEGSMDDLREHIGACPPVFAYPSGQWDAHARRAVADAGIEVAMTTTRGINRLPGADWLTLDRVNVGGATTPALLQAQLLRTTGPLLETVSP